MTSGRVGYAAACMLICTVKGILKEFDAFSRTLAIKKDADHIETGAVSGKALAHHIIQCYF